MKLRRFGVGAAATVLALTAGCGGAADAPTAQSSDLTKANFASKVTQAQSSAQTAHLEAKIDASGQQVSLSGDMDMSKKNVAFDMSMTGPALGGDARFILVDRVIYLKFPGMGQGGKYVKVDAGNANDPVAQMFDQMLSQLNPAQSFQAFDAITKLQQKGTEEIDGVETTHYAVTVDTQQALKAQGMADQVQPGQLPKTITYHVWVDDDNLVRRLRMNVAGTSVNMTLSQWGEPVDISAPPPGQTTDMADMMSQMQGSGGATG